MTTFTVSTNRNGDDYLFATFAYEHVVPLMRLRSEELNLNSGRFLRFDKTCFGYPVIMGALSPKNRETAMNNIINWVGESITSSWNFTLTKDTSHPWSSESILTMYFEDEVDEVLFRISLIIE